MLSYGQGDEMWKHVSNIQMLQVLYPTTQTQLGGVHLIGFVVKSESAE